jgi:Dolichyl-phosphate-mannose-protein mannosyltransferase
MNYLTLRICYIFKQFGHNKSIFLLSIPLILSAFTHLWNPIGFPAVWVVEGQYMHRAMQVLEDFNYHYKQSSIYPYPYDHPFFGQYFLAGMLAVLGYPESLHLSSSSTTAAIARGDMTHSIEMLYLVPRVLIGVLAILDTFLVYKIAERRYDSNRTIALIASILFAVMPITWVLRKILLESLLLPLLLSSILLALYASKDQIRNYNNNKRLIIIKNKNTLLVLLSGIFLGLAILTKIPIFTMIPLVGYLVYTCSNKNWKILGLWLIPVILMPLSWPVDAIFNGDFDLWFKDVIWNTQRQNNDPASAVGGTLLTSLKYLFQIEPVLLILGFAGIFFAEIKRDFLILLWVIPFLIFLFIIDFVSFFYWIPLIPAFCIAAARMIVDGSCRIINKKIHQMLLFAIISGIGIFGIVTTSMLITTNVTSTYFKTYASVVQYLANEEKVNDNHNNNNTNDNNNIITMVGRHWTRGLYWIPKYVYNIDLDFIKVDKVNEIPLSIKREKAILIVDNTIKRSLSDNTNNNDFLNRRQRQLNPYYNTIPIAIFKDNSRHYNLDKYPYTSMSENRDIKWVEIRANANSSKVVSDSY